MQEETNTNKQLRPTLWIMTLVVIAFAAGYLVWAKANQAWPFDNEIVGLPTHKQAVSDTQIFTSEKLGISFEYSKSDNIQAKEIGDKVYVYYPDRDPVSGQWVQVFSKAPQDTLAQAIQKQFLQNIDPKNCFVEAYGEQKAGVDTATISYPPPTDPQAPYWENSKNCPQNYSKSNGISYFYMDESHPTTFLFFSIGQYGIFADKQKGTVWQDTIKIIK